MRPPWNTLPSHVSSEPVALKDPSKGALKPVPTIKLGELRFPVLVSSRNMMTSMMRTCRALAGRLGAAGAVPPMRRCMAHWMRPLNFITAVGIAADAPSPAHVPLAPQAAHGMIIAWLEDLRRLGTSFLFASPRRRRVATRTSPTLCPNAPHNVPHCSPPSQQAAPGMTIADLKSKLKPCGFKADPASELTRRKFVHLGNAFSRYENTRGTYNKALGVAQPHYMAFLTPALREALDGGSGLRVRTVLVRGSTQGLREGGLPGWKGVCGQLASPCPHPPHTHPMPWPAFRNVRDAGGHSYGSLHALPASSACALTSQPLVLLRRRRHRCCAPASGRCGCCWRSTPMPA